MTAWSRADWASLVFTTAVATLLAVAPHLAARATAGTWEYVASGDDALYRPSPATRSTGSPASGTRLPPGADGLIICVLLGPVCPDGPAYRPARHATVARPPGLAGLRRAIPRGHPLPAVPGPVPDNLPARRMGGRGFAHLPVRPGSGQLARPVLDAVLGLWHIFAWTTPNRFAGAIGQYRVLTPLLNLPLLILVIRGFVRTDRRSGRDAALTGLWLGLLTLTYFFFWTAAVGAIGLYAIGHLLASSRVGHLREARFSVVVLFVGAVIGGYQVVNNSLTLADPGLREALDRTSLGYRVPPGDPVRFQYLRNFWAWGTLLVGGIAAVRLRSWDLALIWLLVLVAYLLRNGAVVTGLEFENYHWSYVGCFAAQVLLLTLAGRAADRWAGGRVVWAAGATVVGMVALAGIWRVWEPAHAPETLELNRTVAGLRLLRPAIEQLSSDTSLAGPSEVNVAILTGRCGLLYHTPHTAHRMLVPDREVHARHALNGWLMGVTEAEYAATASDPAFSVTRSARPEWQPEAVRDTRLAVFRKLEATNGGPLLRRHEPLALLRPAGISPPTRGGRWVLRGRSPDWSLWVLEQ